MVRDTGPRRLSRRDVDVDGQAWGSDAIVDLLSAYGHEFVSFNPGASFRGVEESLVNYGGNEAPATIQVQNEGLSVAIAHGYAKATGEPAVCLLHDTVGTLNGAMAIYNAYVDGVPLVILGGNGPLRKSERRPWIDWIHSNLDQAGLVRSVLKWDDEPAHADGLVDSLIRAHRIADTVPKGPTYVTLDHDVQECGLDEPIAIPDFAAYEPPTRLAPDPDAIAAAADRLVAAETPVILVDGVGDSRRAVTALADLADELGAAVVDSYGHLPHRFNVAATHPMNLTGTDVVAEADVALALDVWSVDLKTSSVDRATHAFERHLPDDADLIEIGTGDLEASSTTHDYCELRATELSILADTHLAVPALRDAVTERLDADPAARDRVADRREDFEARHETQRAAWRETAAEAADETPIAPAHLAAVLWDVIADAGDDWTIVAGTLGGWPHRLWPIDEFDQYVGGMSGGGGVGYGIGAAIGGALAYRGSGRVPINLQADGDLMQFLSGLWTIAHYDLPLFTVVHNNGCLYNSTQHRMALAGSRGRDDSFERALVGTSVSDPTPDYASIAEGMGVAGFGPVEDPAALPAVLQRAWSRAAAGEAVLVDVVCQPR